MFGGGTSLLPASALCMHLMKNITNSFQLETEQQLSKEDIKVPRSIY